MWVSRDVRRKPGKSTTSEPGDGFEHLDTCYSVGSYGAFPISLYKLGDEVFYTPQEYDECGLFDSLEEAIADAESEFGSTDDGFHRGIDAAEKHADWMRDQGFGVE